ncbi:MAG: nitrogen fixation protein NifZ [Azoarcus sp.]|jgi:nitrogen fixation protein NifZ|nr:nitrogen fixation protein NifZ [Azoarcus sp.]
MAADFHPSSLSPRFALDDEVRVVRNIRDDGTYPGAARGHLLARRGSVGVVRDIGTFLQDRTVYSVYFYSENRLVGCREEELIGAGEAWMPCLFEFRDKVRSRAVLQVNGKTMIGPGDEGEIVKVLRDRPDGPAYHVHFAAAPGRVFLVPETMLEERGDASPLVVSEKDAELYYQRHPQAFARPEMRTLRHILVTFDDAGQKKDAIALLASLRDRILQSADRAARFAAAALEHSHCPTALGNGLIGTVKPGQLFPELEPHAFSLAEGALSPPLESPVGMHLIFCERIHPPMTMSFEESKARIIAHLGGKR